MSEVKSQIANPTQGGGDDSLPQEVMDRVINEFITAPGRLLLILENLQKENPYNYLPMSVLKYVAKKLLMPVSKVYGVATFYSFFNLKPQGKHCLTVCRGTACHTKRSRFLLDYIVNYLGIKEPINEKEKVFLTTDDRQFTVRTVACFGQCALAPVCEVDGVIYSHMSNESIKEVIEQIKKEDLKIKRLEN